MRMHLRKLLILAAIGMVAPLSPVQAPATAEPMRHGSDCPYAHAAATAAQREAASGRSVAEGIPAISLGGGSSLLAP